MNKIFIYVLKDPDTNMVRYVGKTATPKQRLTNHISEARHHQQKERHKWIYRLLAENKQPVMQIIEECHEDKWEERERFWIDYYRQKTTDLTNIARGGKDSRPPGFVAMVLHSIPMDDNTKSILKALAQKTGISISEHIRRAVDLYLQWLKEKRAND